MKGTKKIIYIVGYPRSGSTILQSILNELSYAVSVGEIKTIIDYNFIKKKPCSCGKQISRCEYWSKIIEKLEREYTIERMANLNKHRSQISNRYFNRVRFRRFNNLISMSNSYGLFLRKLYGLIHETCEVIVDSSKDPMYGWFLSKFLNAEVFYIHLIRDPRACYFSYKKDDLRINPFRWSWMNWNAEFLRRLSPTNYLQVRYEDFANRPKDTLSLILEKFDLPVDKTIIHENKVFLSGTHTLAGNPNRFDSGEIKIQDSRKWYDLLSKFEKIKIYLLAIPLARKYGYK